MDKINLKNMALLAALVLLVINLVSINALRGQIEQVRHDNSRLESKISYIQHEVQSGYSRIQELLDKEQSIFAESSVSLKLQRGKIAVTMSAVPKEITVTEKLIARITADGKIYEEEIGPSGQVEILVDVAEKIKPILIIESDTGVRQETLDELHTRYLFTINTHSEWDHDNDLLTLWLEGPEEMLPFFTNEIAAAEFIVLSIGNMSEEDENIFEQFIAFHDISNLQDNIIKADQIPGEGKIPTGFQADFSAYSEKKDNMMYEIYFILTIGNDMQFVSSNSVASFSVSERSRNMGSGDAILEPVFN